MKLSSLVVRRPQHHEQQQDSRTWSKPTTHKRKPQTQVVKERLNPLLQRMKRQLDVMQELEDRLCLEVVDDHKKAADGCETSSRTESCSSSSSSSSSASSSLSLDSTNNNYSNRGSKENDNGEEEDMSTLSSSCQDSTTSQEQEPTTGEQERPETSSLLQEDSNKIQLQKQRISSKWLLKESVEMLQSKMHKLAVLEQAVHEAEDRRQDLQHLFLQASLSGAKHEKDNEDDDHVLQQQDLQDRQEKLAQAWKMNDALQDQVDELQQCNQRQASSLKLLQEQKDQQEQEYQATIQGQQERIQHLEALVAQYQQIQALNKEDNNGGADARTTISPTRPPSVPTSNNASGPWLNRWPAFGRNRRSTHLPPSSNPSTSRLTLSWHGLSKSGGDSRQQHQQGSLQRRPRFASSEDATAIE